MEHQTPNTTMDCVDQEKHPCPSETIRSGNRKPKTKMKLTLLRCLPQHG